MEYEMSQEDYEDLVKACKQVPYIIAGGLEPPRTRQENANLAWSRLGAKMGFLYMTVRPLVHKGARWFTAEPIKSGQISS